MRFKHFIHTILFIAAISLLSISCNQSKSWENEYVLLEKEGAQLNNEYHQLNVRVDSLWDATTAHLAKAIPEDFPPTDRDIFLNSRNADHIRMFMSFQKLDTATQAIVNDAGKQDALLAGQMRVLQHEIEGFEQKKIAYLREIEQHDPLAGKKFAERFKSNALLVNQQSDSITK